MRPNGVVSIRPRRRLATSSGVQPRSSYIGVSMAPGSTALTRTSGASSRASERVRWCSAALLAPYNAREGTASIPPIDPTFTTVPFVSRSAATAWRIRNAGPSTLVPSIASASANANCSMADSRARPALLTSASMRWKHASVSLTM